VPSRPVAREVAREWDEGPSRCHSSARRNVAVRVPQRAERKPDLNASERSG
jgi:hypothetical protein